jgi:hypothetical protein
MEIVKPTAVVLSLAMVGFKHAHIEPRQFQADPLPTRPIVQVSTLSGAGPTILINDGSGWVDFR